jgi:hypothetical protein
LAAIWIAASCFEGSRGDVLLPREERGREPDDVALEQAELMRCWRLRAEPRREREVWLVMAGGVIVGDVLGCCIR